MRPSSTPDAADVFSLTFGTCCLKTNGTILRLRRVPPMPRPGPHGITDVNNVKSTNITNVDILLDARIFPSFALPLFHRPNNCFLSDKKDSFDSRTCSTHFAHYLTIWRLFRSARETRHDHLRVPLVFISDKRIAIDSHHPNICARCSRVRQSSIRKSGEKTTHTTTQNQITLLSLNKFAAIPLRFASIA